MKHKSYNYLSEWYIDLVAKDYIRIKYTNNNNNIVWFLKTDIQKDYEIAEDITSLLPPQTN